MFIFLNMKDEFRSAGDLIALLLLHLYKLMNLNVHPHLSMKCFITGEVFSPSVKLPTSIAVTRIASSNSFKWHYANFDCLLYSKQVLVRVRHLCFSCAMCCSSTKTKKKLSRNKSFSFEHLPFSTKLRGY